MRSASDLTEATQQGEDMAVLQHLGQVSLAETVLPDVERKQPVDCGRIGVGQQLEAGPVGGAEVGPARPGETDPERTGIRSAGSERPAARRKVRMSKSVWSGIGTTGLPRRC